MSGTLFMVATPIGHLDDITLRALETLKKVDLVACEDTRRTEKLMRHYQIKKRLVRYDEHSHPQASRRLLASLRGGESVALVTDAGTPGISDPGHRLVLAASAEGFDIQPIPGPSSLCAALSVSGMGSDGFVFLGFLPRREGRAKRILRESFGLGRTVVLFESPFRVQALLSKVVELNPQAQVFIAREMTKIYENYIRGAVSEVIEKVKTSKPKGEFVVLVRPQNQEPQPQESAQNQ